MQTNISINKHAKGLAHTKKEFAEIVGIHPANFSSILSEYTLVTEQRMRKYHRKMQG